MIKCSDEKLGFFFIFFILFLSFFFVLLYTYSLFFSAGIELGSMGSLWVT